MTRPAFVKDPDETLDYDVDFNDPRDPWLSTGDTIASATVSLAAGDTSGLVIDSFGHTSTLVKIWASGGTDGETATIEVRVTTTGGRIKEVTMSIRIRSGGC